MNIFKEYEKDIISCINHFEEKDRQIRDVVNNEETLKVIRNTYDFPNDLILSENFKSYIKEDYIENNNSEILLEYLK